MIDINELYNQFCSMYNTSQAGFYRPSPDFDLAAHEASLDVFNILAANLHKSEKIDTWLMPFTKTMNVAVKETANGTKYIPKPADFEYYASSRVIVAKDKTLCKDGCDLLDDDCVKDYEELDKSMFATDEVEYEEHEAELIKSSRWASATSHETKGPLLTRPYLKLREDGYQVVPKEVGVIVLDYLRKPVKPVFSFAVEDLGEKGVYLRYNKDQSKSLEWSEVLVPVFLYRIGKRYGLTIKDQLVIEVSNIEKIFV